MQPDEIKQAFRDWGAAVQNRYAYARPERATHVLQQVRDHAPGTAENAMRDLLKRDGRSRRRFMGARSGSEKLVIPMLPTWAVDPVTASNDADRPHDNPEIPVDLGIPDNLRWIDRLVALMDQQKPLMAACVREEYTTQGSQAVKARRVNQARGMGYDEVLDNDGGVLHIPRFRAWMYRSELDKAVAWIEGFAAASEDEAA